jgi:hypothetical protein
MKAAHSIVHREIYSVNLVFSVHVKTERAPGRK